MIKAKQRLERSITELEAIDPNSDMQLYNRIFSQQDYGGLIDIKRPYNVCETIIALDDKKIVARLFTVRKSLPFVLRRDMLQWLIKYWREAKKTGQTPLFRKTIDKKSALVIGRLGQ